MARKSQALTFSNNGYVYAYKRAPSVPTDNPGDIQFNFALGSITYPVTLLNGWSKTIPTGTDPLYVVTGSIHSTTSLATLQASKWSPASSLAVSGLPGATGQRGSVHAYVSGVSSWNDTAANNAVLANYPSVVVLDVVTLSDSSTGFSQTKVWSGTAWVTISQVIDGNLLVNGSVIAAKVDSRALSIYDAAGAIILNAGGGAALDSSKLGGKGFSGNIIPNADFSSGVGKWTGPAIWNMGGSAYVPTGGHQIGIFRTGTPLTDTFQNSPRITVEASKRYEFSAFLATSGCLSKLEILVYDSSDTLIQFISVPRSNTTDNWGVNLSTWERVGGFITTGATAAYVYLRLNASAAVAGNPSAWITKVQLGVASDNQTILSPWVSGGSSGYLSEIDKIDASNASVVLGTTFITGAHIVDASIDNAKIADLSADKITAGYLHVDRIDAGEVYMDTANIAGGAVTATKTDLYSGPLLPALPANTDNAVGTTYHLLVNKPLPTFTHVKNKEIIFGINMLLRITDANPGLIALELLVNGVSTWLYNIDPIQRLVGGAAIFEYNTTIPVSTSINTTNTYSLDMYLVNGVGTTQRWGGSNPIQLNSLTVTTSAGLR